MPAVHCDAQSQLRCGLIGILAEYVKSPPMRHIRNRGSLHRLALSIVQRLERADSIWRKWNGPREDLARLAQSCWIPVADLRDAFNEFRGPALNNTDVAQRLEAFWLNEHGSLPNEDLQRNCLAIYQEEKAQCTEMRAVIGRIRRHLETEEQRIWKETRERWERSAEHQPQLGAVSPT